MHQKIRTRFKGNSARRKLKKLKRPGFINDASTSTPKWLDYCALKDKHLAIHFSSSLIQQTLYENKQINKFGKIKMVHPWKGFSHRRFYKRKYPYNDHFIGYHGYINPDIVFRKRKGTTRPKTKAFMHRGRKRFMKRNSTANKVNRRRPIFLKNRTYNQRNNSCKLELTKNHNTLLNSDGNIEYMQNGTILPGIQTPTAFKVKKYTTPRVHYKRQQEGGKDLGDNAQMQPMFVGKEDGADVLEKGQED